MKFNSLIFGLSKHYKLFYIQSKFYQLFFYIKNSTGLINIPLLIRLLVVLNLNIMKFTIIFKAFNVNFIQEIIFYIRFN